MRASDSEKTQQTNAQAISNIRNLPQSILTLISKIVKNPEANRHTTRTNMKTPKPCLLSKHHRLPINYEIYQFCHRGSRFSYLFLPYLQNTICSVHRRNILFLLHHSTVIEISFYLCRQFHPFHLEETNLRRQIHLVRCLAAVSCLQGQPLSLLHA